MKKLSGPLNGQSARGSCSAGPARGMETNPRIHRISETSQTNVRRSREARELFYKVLYENQRSRPVEAVRVGVMRT